MGSNPIVRAMKNSKQLKIIPLGGLGEVGRNMSLLEYDRKILIIDMGLSFPGEDLPGVDFIIPNISYLQNRSKDIMGVVFTHGHFDHIGAVPYIIHKIGNPPMFAGALARGIIVKRQEEFPNKKLNIKVVKDGSKVTLGPFKVEFFRQNHSIPDNLGMFIETAGGNILHTSDFKFDKDPVNDIPTDFNKLKSFGKRKVLAMLSDSTGAEQPGHSMSEKEIEKNLEEIFKKTKGRIISATFSSLLNRVQQIISLSEKYGRKVIVEGYSMKNNVTIAKEMGHCKFKKETLIQSKDVDNYPDSKVTIICTGAQGEDRAALMRIINKSHRNIQLKKGDTVILSSSVIPGNERTVQNLKDGILKQKAKVYHYKMMDIHAGGHAKQDELKQMMEMIKPKYIIPVHGQYSMQVAHGELAQELGWKEDDILLVENGNVVDFSQKKPLTKETVQSENVLVDGLGIGDIGEVVLRDRQTLSKDGMFVVITAIDRKTGKVKGSPDIISRGFVYLRESKDLLKETRRRVIKIINDVSNKGGMLNINNIKDDIRKTVSDYLYKKTQRKPVVISVIIEV
jgi:ribonuclease J